MTYKTKLTSEQWESIEYVLKKYLSEEKVEQALMDIKRNYWPDEMDDDSGDEPESFVDHEPKDFPGNF